MSQIIMIDIRWKSTITRQGQRTTDTRRLNSWFFAAQIQISIQNKYLGFGYKCLVFCRINGKHRQGNLSTKMRADEPAENTPNDPKFLSKSKSLGFWWKKALLGVCSPWFCPSSRTIGQIRVEMIKECTSAKNACILTQESWAHINWIYLACQFEWSKKNFNESWYIFLFLCIWWV